MRLSKIRDLGDGSIKRTDGFFIVPQTEMGSPLIEPGMGIGTVELDGIVVGQHGVLEPFHGKEAESTDKPCICDLRVRFDRTRENIDCLFEFSHLSKGKSLVVQGVPVARVNLECCRK